MNVERIPVTDRASWLAMRSQDVTASDVAAVCGVDPYRSPLKVWAEKSGVISPDGDNATLKRGRWLEAAVIEATREERPAWDLRRARVYLRDSSIRLGATPDAVALDPQRQGIGAVQCKTVRRDVYERDWIELEPGVAIAPLGYQLQTLTEAMLVGAAWASVVALVIDAGGGAEFVEAPVLRHVEAEDRIRAAVARFWADMDAGRQPPVTFRQDSEVVSALYPKALSANVDRLEAERARITDALAKLERVRIAATLAAAPTLTPAGEVEAARAELGRAA